MTQCRDCKTYYNTVSGLGAGNLTKCIRYVQRSRGAISLGRSGGGKRKESLQLRLWNVNSTPNSPVAPRRMTCQISANQSEAETSEKHAPRVMTSLLTSSRPISISQNAPESLFAGYVQRALSGDSTTANVRHRK